jgi:TRAP-type mannitol/chloroaromatic compound transport system permease large subunit
MNMSPDEMLAIAMIAAFFVLLIVGIPVGIAIAASAFVFGYIGFGPTLFNLLPSRVYGVVTNYTFMAIPLFVFMGVMLEKSRLAEELIDVVGHLFGASPAAWAWRSSRGGAARRGHRHRRGDHRDAGPLTLPTLLRRGYPNRSPPA